MVIAVGIYPKTGALGLCVRAVPGQVLSLPAPDELTQPGAMSGRIQVAGGLSAQESRPEQIAQVLKSPLKPAH